MTDLQRKLDRLVQTFVDRVVAEASEAAMASIAVDTPAARGKRSRAELDDTRALLRAFLAAHPGLRIEQINRDLGSTTAELALPLKTLIAEGVVRTEGNRRATRYYLDESRA